MRGYGIFAPSGEAARAGALLDKGIRDLSDLGDEFRRPSLNAFMAAGPELWKQTYEQVVTGEARDLHALKGVELSPPFELGDYVDFYSSLEHATNMGRLFRPGSEPLLPNWRWLPVGYHGRAGTVVPSGTPIVRPGGQRKPAGSDRPTFGPTERLDLELELGFVVGVGSDLGRPVPASAFREHVFGVVLVNDWSARDLQAWEYQPLGPFLGKSFATSISAWVTPLAALEDAWVQGPSQEPEPLPYLRTEPPGNLDVDLEVELNGETVSRTNARGLYWSFAQQLAHATVNGASVRTGDLFASGTISGSEPDTEGSLIELTRNGERPLRLADGSERTFLEDGDEVVLRGRAGAVELGEVAGRIIGA